jgi:hypothetical protein
MFLVRGVTLTYTARPATVWRAVVVPTFKEYMLMSSLLHKLFCRGFDWASISPISQHQEYKDHVLGKNHVCNVLALTKEWFIFVFSTLLKHHLSPLLTPIYFTT